MVAYLTVIMLYHTIIDYKYQYSAHLACVFAIAIHLKSNALGYSVLVVLYAIFTLSGLQMLFLVWNRHEKRNEENPVV